MCWDSSSGLEVADEDDVGVGVLASVVDAAEVEDDVGVWVEEAVGATEVPVEPEGGPGVDGVGVVEKEPEVVGSTEVEGGVVGVGVLEVEVVGLGARIPGYSVTG